MFKKAAHRAIARSRGHMRSAEQIALSAPMSQLAFSVQKATHAAFIYSFNDAVRFAVLTIAFGILVSFLFIRRKDMQHTNGAPPTQQAVRAPELVEVEH